MVVKSRYDLFDQVIAEADPLVKAELKTLSLLNPEEKARAAQENRLWAEKSLRHQYNDVGLKIKSTDPLGNNTFYYYDKFRNLIFTVDATGAITENTYTTFKKIDTQRRYYHPHSRR